MEFLRFGSSIPGGYWGCCACCIIQNFKVDPDAKASIELVSGDGGNPVMKGGKKVFAGPTYRDIFHQRLRFGTFDKRDMPNHAFFAILTESQISGGHGKQWLAILKEAGFEFIRSVSNSVYTGQNLSSSAPTGKGSSLNHIFGLFRNIGSGGAADQFTPPEAWLDLPSVGKVEGVAFEDGKEATKANYEADLAIWNKIGPANLLTEEELVAAGVPVTYAGRRSMYPPQEKSVRENVQKSDKNYVQPVASNPFGTMAA